MSSEGPETGEQPNIVWITVESTRADHTSLGDGERDTTPGLQAIADSPRGRAFEQCITHGIWTLSSSASLLTGTYPSRHGAGMVNDAIPETLTTIPELLGEVGYHTACLSPNSHLSSGTGLDRGFDDFAWISKSTVLDVAGPKTVLKYLLNIRRHGGGFTTDTAKHGSGFIMQDMTKRWLRSFSGDREPFFLYAHYGDPHHPYYPPLPYLRQAADEVGVSAERAGSLALDYHRRLNELIADGCPFSDEEWQTLEKLYDAAIEYVDELLSDLFDYVRSLDLGPTVFIVTADHGELFGEQGMLAHKVVVDDAVSHVPLVVHGFDEILSYEGETVQHADVMRTLLETVGADTEQLQGIDMREEEREFSIVQRGGQRCRKNLDRFTELNPEFDASRYHASTLHAIRTTEFKYQRSDEKAELYALPDETADVSAEYEDVAERLDGELSNWLEMVGDPAYTEPQHGDFTDDMKAQLAGLGYLVE